MRNESRLEIDFTPYLVKHEPDGGLAFEVWDYRGPNSCEPTGRFLGDHVPEFKHANPLLEHEDAGMRHRIETTRQHVERWITENVQQGDCAPEVPIGPGIRNLWDHEHSGPTGRGP